ncbi:MAG TPA: DivIVA domain-containing protein [Solirubrobacteraceae bacterium]|jgi:DivIVA domain-containing protein|nr:DivIVA domain-containing protein [Solirubrobacteraceae bacterium]
MTDLDTRHPEFTVAIRGYDRAQVDEYVDYLQRLVADAEDRARDAEAEYVFDEHAAVGPRIAEMFALAEAEARDLRNQVSQETGELLAEARKETKAIIDAAERSARDVKQRAQRDHEEMLAEFERDRNRIRDEAVALELRKAEAVGDLRRLRDLLGEASGVVARAAAGEPQIEGPSDGETVELPALAASAQKA